MCMHIIIRHCSPKSTNINSNTVHGVSVHIYSQAVEEQFADADYDRTERNMKFQSTTRDADPAIEIKFENHLPNGWSITRKSGRKVWSS